jgi:two-component system, chemotaxis family, chemotaxis protein CheY
MQGETELSRFKLPTTLDLAAAEGLLDTLARRLQDQTSLVVDASEVATLTSPCIQVLLAARRSFEHLPIERPSSAFVSAIEDIGLDRTDLCDEAASDLPLLVEIEQPVEAEQTIEADAQAEPEQPSVVPEVAGEADSPPEAAETATMAKRILTIDDSKTIRDMLMLTLAEAGFEVLQAVDGQHGLDVLDKETAKVDVVITDINMPRMDGYEVIRQLRKNAAHKTTPILVLTTESESDKKNLAREAGATGWMVKPFDPDRLIATINKVAQ